MSALVQPIAGTVPQPGIVGEPAPRLIGEMLIARGAVSENDIAKALSFQSSYGGRLGAILVRIAVTTDGADIEGDVALLRELAEEAPVVELVSNTLAQAVNEGASDIHVEPREREFDIRYRIDGVLQDRLTLPRSRFDAVA